MFNLTEEQEERARRLHKESIVVDTLAGGGATIYAKYIPAMLERATTLIKEGTPSMVINRELNRILMEDLISGRSDIEREWMELSGVDVFHMTTPAPGREPFERALVGIARWQRKIDSLDYLVKATTFKDIERAKADGKHAIIMGFQDSDHFGRDLDKLQLFYDLGIRIIQLTYNLRNLVGSGCTERADGGLSLFGVEVVKRMNELGILVDVSHCGYQTTMDAIEISSVPVAVTHSFSREVYEHARAKTDEQIQALAAKNGYFGVVTVPFFLSDLSQKQTSLNDVLDHIEHVAGIMGIDRVGIGTDYAGPIPEPMATRMATRMKESLALSGWREEHQITADAVVEGFGEWREWPNITRGLVSRGYSEDEIKGILGGNFLRIFKEIVG